MKKNKGSILIESLLSVLILSVAIVSQMQTMQASFDALLLIERMIPSIVFCENKLDEFFMQGEVDLNLISDETIDGVGRLSTQVSRHDNNDSLLNEVIFSCSWQQNGRAKNVVVSTYVFNAK